MFLDLDKKDIEVKSIVEKALEDEADMIESNNAF